MCIHPEGLLPGVPICSFFKARAATFQPRRHLKKTLGRQFAPKWPERAIWS